MREAIVALCSFAPVSSPVHRPAILGLRERVLKNPGDDRQRVALLNAIRSDGIEAATVACEPASEAGTPTNRQRSRPSDFPIPETRNSSWSVLRDHT